MRGAGNLRGINYEMPVASAQVKSAVLLAGLYADGVTAVREPAVTRDHTERMLESMGASIQREGATIAVRGGQQLQGSTIEVPGDLSSAAFVMLAALLADNGETTITSVGVNPTRTGVIDILRLMGADISLENERLMGQEPVADVRVRSSQLTGCAVDPSLVPLAIDEFPVLFVAAAAANGQTTFTGLAELRVKESDRIAAMAAGLQALGVNIVETPDGAIVYGGEFGSGVVESFGDHRIAMALAVAGSAAAGPVTVRDVAAVDTSFPGFVGLMGTIGVDIEVTT